MTPGPDDITRLLNRARDPADHQARQESFRLVEQELRALAALRLSRLPSHHSLRATELIDEAFVRLIDGRHVDWQGRGEFFRIAAGVMRRLLCDHVRRAVGRRREVPLDPADHARLADGRAAPPDVPLRRQEMLLALLVALGKLEAEDADAAAVFELRYFGGRGLVPGAAHVAPEADGPQDPLLSYRELADACGVPRATAADRWSRAVRRLRVELQAFGPEFFEDAADAD